MSADKQRPRPCAWAMRIPGCDGSADWVEIGEQEPEPWPPAVACPLYDQAAIDAAVEQESARQNASRSLMSEQRAEARQAALEKDAARYRWLKSRQGLTLRSEKQPNVWKRIDGSEFSATHSLAEGGTQHSPADSLDALIDAAAKLAERLRDA